MASEAAIGYGSTLASGDGGDPEVFTDWGELVAINGPEQTRDMHDATHMASPNRYREFVPGLIDAGQVDAELRFIPGGATEALIKTMLQATTASNFTITTPNNEDYLFTGFVISRGQAIPLDDLMMMPVSIKVSGRPAFMA